MRPSSTARAAILLMVCSGLSTAEELKSRETVPQIARPIVRPIMMKHGDDLLQLVAAVTLLQYPEIDAAARRIAVSPTLARPLPENDGSELQMPPRFYELQDMLKERARGLGRSARMRDDDALARDLGMMMQACVSCHSAYLVRSDARKAPIPSKR